MCYNENVKYKEKEKKSMTILIIALIVVAIVAGAGTAFYYNQPENVVLNSVAALVEDITERVRYAYKSKGEWK